MENVKNSEHSKPVSVECSVKGQPPNPGSDTAVAMGCTCPRVDNGYGRIGNGNGPFWITCGCPLHDAL